MRALPRDAVAAPREKRKPVMRIFDDLPRSADGDMYEVPLMPLREVVMFPHTIMPLFVGRMPSIKAIENAMSDYGKKICLIVQREPDDERPEIGGLYPMGVISRILQLLRLPDGTIKVLFEGLRRVYWQPVSEDAPFGCGVFPRVFVRPTPPWNSNGPQSEALVRATHEALEEYGRANKKISQEALAVISGLRDPGRLADTVVSHLKIDYGKKQELLETLDPAARLEKVYEALSSEITVATLEKQIKSRVKTQMERNQREYYLNEQIKAIHKEMGQEDDPKADVNELEQRLESKELPDEARERARREIKKLMQMSPSSAEYTVVRNYVDWILDLPWNRLKETSIDIKAARDILDGDHYGLDKPKERILEYLAVQKLTSGLKGPILCFVGPPGVGKTSLAKSVARATGRECVRISLGGVRDEAEIRGHRRTYVGAMPGKILTALKRAKYNNPLFCLDEVDKMSTDFRGDPAAALLEVLDPEQNATFNDHYLDLDYDLSKVFFITTANSLQSIPIALQDRMEIIQLNSYLEVEKRRIAVDFLLPRQLETHGLRPHNLRLSENALLDIIRSYTREAGVRSLERELASLCRKIAIRLVENGDMESQVNVTRHSLASLLGVKRYRYGEREREPQTGVCTGLAYNERGGALLMVETAIMPGTGKVVTTGQLGEVMTESAQAAVSYIRSRSDLFDLRADFHKDVDIHVHVPEGATPKDGPSAGITMATSIVSALLGIPVRNEVAMTGEVTLRGRVLPIGGLREKLLAASRGGMTTVIMPRDNEKDLKEVPDEILKALEIVFVEHVDEVLPLALAVKEETLFGRRVHGMLFSHNLRRNAHAEQLTQ
jgi:ATP-dependent Lon protease